MVSAYVRDNPGTYIRQKVGKTSPWRAPFATLLWRPAAHACGLRPAPNRTGACSSRDCISAIAGAPPAAPGSRGGATTTPPTTRRSSPSPTIFRTRTASAFSISARPSVRRAWWSNQERRAAEGENSGRYTVAHALADYIVDYKRRGGKRAEAVQSVVRRNVLPELGGILVHKLTTRRLLEWHHAIAERPRNWRSRPGAAPNLSTFDPKDAEAVRRRRATANRLLSHVKAALNHAWRNGAVPSDDAWRRVKPFRGVSAPVIRYLTQDEMRS